MGDTAEWILEARRTKEERRKAAVEAALPRTDRNALKRSRQVAPRRGHGRQTR